MYDVALAPHSPLGPIALAACVQVAISAPNFIIQEMSVNIHYNTSPDPNFVSDLDTYLLNPQVFKVTKGHIPILEGPGLGIQIDEELVRRISANYVEKYPAWRNPIWRGEDGSLREW